jgi:hypothetical protein
MEPDAMVNNRNPDDGGDAERLLTEKLEALRQREREEIEAYEAGFSKAGRTRWMLLGNMVVIVAGAIVLYFSRAAAIVNVVAALILLALAVFNILLLVLSRAAMRAAFVRARALQDELRRTEAALAESQGRQEEGEP